MIRLIINEQHNLFPEQERLLEQFSNQDLEVIKVPANGWTLTEMKAIAREITNGTVIFASPIPYLLSRLSFDSGHQHGENFMGAVGTPLRVLVFHNDNRIKKELLNGKIIQTVAPEGWVLV